MIYIIGSCYLHNHKEECIIVKNNSLMIEEMTNIVGALANLYFYSTDKAFCPPAELLDKKQWPLRRDVCGAYCMPICRKKTLNRLKRNGEMNSVPNFGTLSKDTFYRF